MQRTYYNACENDGVPLGEELRTKKEALAVIQEEIDYLITECEDIDDLNYFEFYIEKVRETEYSITYLEDIPVYVDQKMKAHIKKNGG